MDEWTMVALRAYVALMMLVGAITGYRFYRRCREIDDGFWFALFSGCLMALLTASGIGGAVLLVGIAVWFVAVGPL